MKAILVGLGSAGYGWYKRIRQAGLELAVVETDPNNRSKADDGVPLYVDLEEAIGKEQPDFVVNVTPPQVHTRINTIAFDHKLPVLCEKPIAFDYAESVDIVGRSERERIPFMIAENYRRFAYMRKLKQVLESGVIGAVSTMDVSFYRYHNVQRNYSVSLLDDIAVHHFDLMRYLSGREGRKIYARLFNPIGHWGTDSECLAMNAQLELDGGIMAAFTGSISARGPETEWGGHWRIEGSEGAVLVANQEIRVVRDGEVTVINDYRDVDSPGALADFLRGLRDGTEFETSGRDYLKTQAIVHYANESHRENRPVNIVLGRE
ncbi:Oxidoreductase family, NAD-binding Rossmann fold [Chlamydia abortus]|uniref:Gfo/Idh/MocA family protein n=1 Tax=Paenibacillus residui TaxID=629724 RepID=A0ABW3D3Y0_9BACL|nr:MULTISPECIES: Gfo/Idh/MocA family oxidoreductase [Paenibacillaceae]SHE13196.1 Oxidoreductase family, NAD-binding Rossmann fold [Chlamydia abortus]